MGTPNPLESGGEGGVSSAAVPEEHLSGQLQVGDGSFDRRSEVLRVELERRIELIESADDDEFGNFTAFDWTICTIVFLVLPLLIAWWSL